MSVQTAGQSFSVEFRVEYMGEAAPVAEQVKQSISFVKCKVKTSILGIEGQTDAKASGWGGAVQGSDPRSAACDCLFKGGTSVKSSRCQNDSCDPGHLWCCHPRHLHHRGLSLLALG